MVIWRRDNKEQQRRRLVHGVGRGDSGVFTSSRRKIFRWLLMGLAFFAIFPPLFFHFKLRRFQQMQLLKCSWLKNPPLVCAHGGDSSKAFPNTLTVEGAVGREEMANIVMRFGKGLVPWFRTKLDPLVQILRRGAEPKQLAFSGALGITFGIFPICGVTVFLCGMAIALLRSSCHAPTVMLANFIATPIELSLIIFFLRFGEFITGGPHFPLTSDAFKKVLTGQASREILHSIFNALLGWLVAAPFILGILYVLFLPCFNCLVRKFSVVPTSPKLPLQSIAEARVKVRDV